MGKGWKERCTKINKDKVYLEKPLDFSVLSTLAVDNYVNELISLRFPGGSDGKASACNAGDPGSIPGWGRSPGDGNGNPVQYSCLENPTDRGAW